MSASAEKSAVAPLQELKIAIRATEDGFEAQVLASPFRGFAESALPLPWSHEELQELWANAWEQPVDREGWQRIGGPLFDALFRGAVGEAFERARLLDKRLRVRLVFRAQDEDSRLLSLVPWESLWDETERSFLGAQRRMPLVRQIDGGNRPTRELAVQEPLRILPVVAAPTGQHPFDARMAERQLLAAFAPLTERSQAKVLPCPHPATVDALFEALVDHDPHVLHFLGHGGFDSVTGKGLMAFEREDGSDELIDGEMLLDLLKQAESLRLVVLTSCETALFGATPFLSLTAATAVYTDVPAMIAMQSFLKHDAADVFSRQFYERLAAGDDVDVAMSHARFSMARRDSQWLLPVLFMSSPDGRLLAGGNGASGRPGTLSVAVPPPPPPRAEPLRLGVRSLSPHSPDLEAATDRHLSLLQHFDRREIKHPDLWPEAVYPELAAFLGEAATERRHLELYFAAHHTVAFAAGWVLQAKSGLDIGFLQGGQAGAPVAWHPRDGSAPAEGPLWSHEPDLLVDADAADVAIALSLTHPITSQVVEYLEASGTRVRRIVPAQVAPRAGHQALRGGEHALRLAGDIAYRAMQRTPQERRGTLHLFAAAPNAFLFYLGQLARPFGRIQLYEYGFDDTAHPGEYVPSLVLPPPAD